MCPDNFNETFPMKKKNELLILKSHVTRIIVVSMVFTVRCKNYLSNRRHAYLKLINFRKKRDSRWLLQITHFKNQQN